MKKAWEKNYRLAKIYYEHHGHLNIHQTFKTTNGYEYDEEGSLLGQWINRQKLAHNGKINYKIDEAEIQKLKEIGMCFEIKNREEEWNKYYTLAKSYYNHYGNLDIPQTFKTINGYEDDENGFCLGIWLYSQKLGYNGKRKYKSDEFRSQKLREIGMCFDIKSREKEWNKKYTFAKAYYNYHGNLNIPSKFKTKNGYTYDEEGIRLGKWICDQRDMYKGTCPNVISEEHLFLLEKIGMIWFGENTDKKFQQESIDSENIIRKKREILNRFLSSLLTMRKNMFTEKEDIKELNESFLRCLK